MLSYWYQDYTSSIFPQNLPMSADSTRAITVKIFVNLFSLWILYRYQSVVARTKSNERPLTNNAPFGMKNRIRKTTQFHYMQFILTASETIGHFCFTSSSNQKHDIYQKYSATRKHSYNGFVFQLSMTINLLYNLL